MTYFRMGIHTIIGAPPFHGPVRDGKAWFQRAVVVRLWRWEEVKRGQIASAQTPARSAHGYGIKPHGLLVSVSSRHYCPSTPDLSTWWSATTLQGG